ncbi:MAG: hypothetical protein ACP5T3_02470 [Candidatus Micrarchaeia archaeon]
MKAQLSLEFLLYVGLAGLSLAVAGRAVPQVLHAASESSGAYSVLSFASSLNTALLYGNSTVFVFLPHGICNATISGTTLSTRWGSYGLVLPIVAGNALCPDGMRAEIGINVSAGVAHLWRIS